MDVPWKLLRFFSNQFPEPGNPTPHDRGGYPVRNGDRSMNYTPDDLRSSETETQGWIQFETSEYIIDRQLRGKILQLMVDQGRNKACGFVGPLDVILRQGEIPEVNDAINDLFRKAKTRHSYLALPPKTGPTYSKVN